MQSWSKSIFYSSAPESKAGSGSNPRTQSKKYVNNLTQLQKKLSFTFKRFNMTKFNL